MIYTGNVKKAFDLASAMYEGLVDKSGVPIVNHAVEVAEAVKDYGEEFEIVALLHDAFEEDYISEEDFDMLDVFGDDVKRAVRAITINAGEDYYLDYLPRVFDDPIASVVKIADSKNNYNRLGNLDDPELVARLSKKYENVFKFAGVA